MPAKLAARARVFDTGQGRKTDATDAHAIVMVALRDKGLREVSTDLELMVLRMLCDRRDELSRARAQALNRMHRLHESTQTTHIYEHADPALKEQAIARTAPLGATPGRYRPPHALLAFLESL